MELQRMIIFFALFDRSAGLLLRENNEKKYVKVSEENYS